MSGPLHLGGICWRGRNQRPVITGTTVGLLLAGIFGVGAMIVRAIPGAAEPIARVLQFAHQGTLLPILLITLINGIAEEMFFRGALYTALGRRYPVTISTVLYVGATMASANLMLGFAAIFVGTVCALERRASGGVLAPILTHFVWGLIMVFALPRCSRSDARSGTGEVGVRRCRNAAAPSAKSCVRSRTSCPSIRARTWVPIR